MKILQSMEIDTNYYLRDIENFLRNNITFILKDKYGERWFDNLGVTEGRVEEWKKRKEEEKQRLNGKELVNDLLYYSDFHDLKNIMYKNWDVFSSVFKKRKELEYQLDMLESFRNPNAHNRDLLEHQKHLLVGIVGEIKNNIIEYRGSIEKEESYFLKIDSVNVNGKIYNQSHWIKLKDPLRIGDKLDINIFISLPPNQNAYYAIRDEEIRWKEDSHFIVEIDEKEKIGDNSIMFFVKSDQDYHKYNSDVISDARLLIEYTILP